MRGFYCHFNDLKNTDLDVVITKRPNIPSPYYEYEEVPIEGRGTLYRKKYLKDINIEVEFAFLVDDPNEWNKRLRKVKKWVNKINDNKLRFSDDLDFFYYVNKATIKDSEREIRRVGRFTVVFTCEPYMYLEDGLESITLKNELYNEFEETRPIYKISGEGLFFMSVNGKTIKANVGQNLTIDTKLGLCFRADGEINNIALNGKYSDMYLLEGENTFSFSDGFNVEIIPNWRCL